MKRSSCNANEKEEEKSCDVLIASMGEGEWKAHIMLMKEERKVFKLQLS
jgi:hypothetical protein